jgi:hypothetical protein
MQLVLFPENIGVVRSLDTKRQNRNIRQELLRGLPDCMNVREIKLQENGLFSRLVLELGDRLVRLLGAARCEVNLRIAHKELLKGSTNQNSVKVRGSRTNAPLQFPFRHQYYHLVVRVH